MQSVSHSKISSFINSLSANENIIEIVNNDSFDVSFYVELIHEIIISEEKVSLNEKNKVSKTFDNRNGYDAYLRDFKEENKLKSNSAIKSAERGNNYGSLVGEVKLIDDEFVCFTENCNICKNTGFVKCSVCHGHKVFTCETCKGRGCKQCRQIGKVRCVACNAEAQEKCGACFNEENKEVCYKVGVKSKVTYRAIFKDGTDRRIIQTIESNGGLDKLKSKNIVYINSIKEFFLDDDGKLKNIFYMSCPFSIVKVKYGRETDELILYGISQRIVDINGMTEKILKSEENKLFQIISDTNIIGGNHEELVASLCDYTSIPIHQRIFVARNGLIKREITPTSQTICNEIDNVISVEYIDRVLRNVKRSIFISSVCLKARYMVPSIVFAPFLYAILGIFIDDPLRLVVSLLSLVGIYFYTSFVFIDSIKRNGGEHLDGLNISTI